MFGERLEQARRLSGLSQQKLADLLGINKMTISKYENGVLPISSERLLEVCNVLGIGIDYFFRTSQVTLVGEPVFRKRRKLGKKEERAILFQSQDILERQKEIMQILNIDPLSVRPNLKTAVSSVEDAERLAGVIRDEWKLGLDPIENLMEVVEKNGFSVGVVDASDSFDALTVQSSDGEQLVVLRNEVPGDRQRFTLAHELGHYFIEETENIEQYANLFAGALLVPRESLIVDVGEKRNNIPLEELYDLKMKYGASMMAILYRMRDTGIISDTVLKRYQILFGRNQWRKEEPGAPYPVERPMQMRQWVNRAYGEGMISMSRRRELLGESVSLDLVLETA